MTVYSRYCRWHIIMTRSTKRATTTTTAAAAANIFIFWFRIAHQNSTVFNKQGYPKRRNQYKKYIILNILSICINVKNYLLLFTLLSIWWWCLLLNTAPQNLYQSITFLFAQSVLPPTTKCDRGQSIMELNPLFEAHQNWHDLSQ